MKNRLEHRRRDYYKYSFGNLLADCVAALTIIGAWWLLLWMFGAFR